MSRKLWCALMSVGLGVGLGTSDGLGGTMDRPCEADWNGDYVVNSADVGAYLTAYFEDLAEGTLVADFDGNGVVNSGDVGQYLTAYFAGRGPCPGEPDLVVTGVVTPEAFGLGLSHPISVTIGNTGKVPARGRVNVLTWLTLDGDPFSGNDDIPMGGPSGGVELDLAPGETETVSFQSLVVPGNALVGNQVFVACVDVGAGCAAICEEDEGNNCRGRIVRVACDDAAVVNIAAPSEALSGNLVPVTTTVINHSALVRDIPVRVCLGGNCAEGWANNVPAGGTREVTLSVVAPASEFDCGQPDAWVITSCANLGFDCDRANDCANRTIMLIDRYWDLAYELVSPPDEAFRCNGVTLRVRVRNVGNWESPLVVCSRVGICLDADPVNWTRCINCPGPLFFGVERLQPGQSRTYTFAYNVCCNAAVGRQWIKAGPDYFSGCRDDCNGSNNNNALEAIQVR